MHFCCLTVHTKHLKASKLEWKIISRCLNSIVKPVKTCSKLRKQGLDGNVILLDNQLHGSVTFMFLISGGSSYAVFRCGNHCQEEISLWVNDHRTLLIQPITIPTISVLARNGAFWALIQLQYLPVYCMGKLCLLWFLCSVWKIASLWGNHAWQNWQNGIWKLFSVCTSVCTGADLAFGRGGGVGKACKVHKSHWHITDIPVALSRGRGR